MTQLKKTVDPFGEVNVYPGPNNRTRVTATILMEPYKEGAQTGIALDGSGSMKKLYGEEAGGVVSPIFKKQAAENYMSPVAQELCGYLADKIDADGGTTCIYWAVGMGGQEVQVIGDMTGSQVRNHVFGPPAEYGTGTYLLPAVKYFVDRFRDAPWGFYVFITDGELFDLEEVKQYTTQLAQDIEAGRRNPVKFVLIGLGEEVNGAQLEDLDDLDTGTSIDLWDHKLASELRVLEQIFAEVVDENTRVADHGKILAPNGAVLANFSDTGLPAFLEFEVATGTSYFTLEVNGNRIQQPLSDTAVVPSSEINASLPQRTPAQSQTQGQTNTQTQGQTPTPPPLPKEATEIGADDLIEDPQQIVNPDEDDDALWKQIDLRPSEEDEKL
ncbi:MAG: vWA domain-containing protein [Gemmataceae bacterium]